MYVKMGKYVDVTLVGLTCEFAADGEPVEITGALRAKTFSRHRFQKDSEDLYVAHDPVAIAVGESLAIDKTVRLALSTDTSELAVMGELLSIGGDLGLGGRQSLVFQGHQVQNIVVDEGNPGAGIPPTEAGRPYDVRFASDDGSLRVVRADFVLKVAHWTIA
jgi:hypothetical protein